MLFRSKVFFKTKRPSKKPERKEASLETPMDNGEKLKGLSSELLEIYKSIPRDAPVSQESLVTEKLPMRELMRALLKLEIKGLVTLMPGDFVKRNP